jgi:hypothetical protein
MEYFRRPMTKARSFLLVSTENEMVGIVHRLGLNQRTARVGALL